MKTIDKKLTLKEKLEKMLEEKRLIQSYLRGEITLEKLNEKGIELVMPI
jgi:hypothetical protein